MDNKFIRPPVFLDLSFFNQGLAQVVLFFFLDWRSTGITITLFWLQAGPQKILQSSQILHCYLFTFLGQFRFAYMLVYIAIGSSYDCLHTSSYLLAYVNLFAIAKYYLIPVRKLYTTTLKEFLHVQNIKVMYTFW